MLVLSRRQGQKIVIGNEIVVEILSVGNDGVRLGITAPNSTSVHRFEVFEEIQRANQAAAQAADEIESISLQNLTSLFKDQEPF